MQRAVVESGVVDESVVFADEANEGSKVYEFGGDEDAATRQCGRCSDDEASGGSGFNFSVPGVAAEEEWRFEKGFNRFGRRVRVARRIPLVGKADGFGGAGAFGVLAVEEDDEVEEPVN